VTWQSGAREKRKSQMGDYFQTIVDREVSTAEAQTLASTIRDWLITEQIVEGTPTDCILGSDGGYAPGSHFEEVLAQPDINTRRLRTNGLEIDVGRTVFHAGQFGLELICPQCGARSDRKSLGIGSEMHALWGKAVDEWYFDRGPGILACARCGQAISVVDWCYDPPWGFGNLGFTFWNWPSIKESFVTEMSRRLGHRSVLVRGKI